MIDENTDEARSNNNNTYISRGDINEIQIMGNVGKEPELKIQGTKVFLVFSVATSRSFIKDGVQKTNTEWHRVHVYGKRADAVAQKITKGIKVFVRGEMRSSTITQEHNQQQKYYYFIEANIVSLPILSNRKNGDVFDPDINNLSKNIIHEDDFPL